MERSSTLKKIRLVACDFDGIMTDGHVYVDEHGTETVRCSRLDGLGIALLKQHGIEVVVISKETNPVVSERCKKLGINCYQGIETGQGKGEVLARLIASWGLAREEVLYAGDDYNDIPALQLAGVAVTVSDAPPLVKGTCTFITHARRGEHVVREVAQAILQAKNISISI